MDRDQALQELTEIYDSIALHEAAHFIMQWCMQIAVRNVKIEESGKGYVMPFDFTETIEEEAAILAAGPIVDYARQNRNGILSANTINSVIIEVFTRGDLDKTDDCSKILQILESSGIDDKWNYLNGILTETAVFLSDHSTQLVEVAREIRRKSGLDQSESEKIFKNLGKPRFIKFRNRTKIELYKSWMQKRFLENMKTILKS